MYKKTFTGRELYGTPERKATPRREGKPAVKGIYEQNIFPSEEFKQHTQKGDPSMIWLFKGQEAKLFNDEQVENMYREGWSPKRPKPAPVPKKQPPEPKGFEGKGQEESDKPKFGPDQRLEDIKQGVSLVLEAGEPKDINTNGYPDVRAVERVIGFDITPNERDDAYEEIMKIHGD